MAGRLWITLVLALPILSRIAATKKKIRNVRITVIAMETQQWASHALLYSYKMFRTSANNVNKLKFTREVTDVLSSLEQIRSSSTDFCKCPQYQISSKSVQCELR
jgi:3'-phosphoadenosine 5'-phosphosulfate sulfotransferase